jgi:hypothetical protein
MIKKSMPTLSTIIAPLCLALLVGHFVGQQGGKIIGYVPTSVVLTDGDPMPPFPIPPNHPFRLKQNLNAAEFIADGDPMPPFPIPPAGGPKRGNLATA